MPLWKRFPSIQAVLDQCAYIEHAQQMVGHRSSPVGMDRRWSCYCTEWTIGADMRNCVNNGHSLHSFSFTPTLNPNSARE